MKYFAVVEVEIRARDAFRVDGVSKLECIASYLNGAFNRAMRECDPADRVKDLIVFPDRIPEAKELQHLLKHGLLSSEMHAEVAE